MQTLAGAPKSIQDTKSEIFPPNQNLKPKACKLLRIDAAFISPSIGSISLRTLTESP
jgi:hypothetical protein